VTSINHFLLFCFIDQISLNPYKYLTSKSHFLLSFLLRSSLLLSFHLISRNPFLLFSLNKIYYDNISLSFYVTSLNHFLLFCFIDKISLNPYKYLTSRSHFLLSLSLRSSLLLSFHLISRNPFLLFSLHY
jgi:hypothetical protein